MNITQLTCFYYAAQTLNYTQAASTVHVTPQAVSKYILDLELELHTELFIKKGNKLELTNAGEYYKVFFAEKWHEFNHVLKEAKQLNAVNKCQLNLGLSSWIDPFGKIDNGISSFREQHPYINFHCLMDDPDNLMELLKAKEVDIILLPEAQLPDQNEYELIPFAKEETCLFAPPYILDNHLDPQCWSLPFLHLTNKNWNYPEWRRIGKKKIKKMGLEPKQVWFVHNTNTLYSHMLLHTSVTIADAHFGRLTNSPQLYDLRKFPIHTGYHYFGVCLKDGENTIAKEFIEYMRQFYLS